MKELKINSLSKKFKNITAVDNVSLEIPYGSIGLLGPNGAGKTTLLRIVSTLLEADSGTVSFGNISWKEEKKVKQMLGYLPQHFQFYPYLTVKETLEYIAVLKKIPQKASGKLVEDIIEENNLEKVKNQKLSTLSGGTYRRVGIAQALLNNPTLLLIDEPTAGLDPEERIRLRNLLTMKSKDRIMIISTHIAEDIDSTCEYVAIMKNGKILVFDRIQQVKKEAEGFIYELVCPESEYKTIAKEKTVISFCYQDEFVKVRFLSKDRFLNSKIVAPTLEDAYMWILKRED